MLGKNRLTANPLSLMDDAGAALQTRAIRHSTLEVADSRDKSWSLRDSRFLAYPSANGMKLSLQKLAAK
jgi:hypothetical protein